MIITGLKVPFGMFSPCFIYNINDSISGGVFLPNRISRHMCAATEKLSLYSCFLSFFSIYVLDNQFRKVIHY